MNGGIRLISRPLWRARWAARAPKLVLAALVTVLSLAGLRTALAGPREVAHTGPADTTRDLAAEGFAEAFVRTYLTWDPAHPERRERQVSLFASDALEPDAGLSPPARKVQRVVWTAAIRDEPASSTRHLITVAAETTNSSYYVSVPVQHSRRGLFAIAGYPALVGAPPVDRGLSPNDGREVNDPVLRSVARRAIANYLRGEAQNLRADLDPHAVVALPGTPLRVTSVDALSWAGPARVAVELRAEGGGASWTLRYELGVVKRERWYVRSIQSNPNARRSE